MPAEEYRGKGAEHGDGSAQQHAEGQRPALVLGGQNQKTKSSDSAKMTETGTPSRAFFS
jgi:hypothetical protein